MAKAKHGAPLAFLIDRARGQDGDACVLWPYRLANGYGHLDVEGRQRGAHQVVLELAGQARPTDAHEACHSCGTPACVNLTHLRWGTHADNQQDRFQRHGDTMQGERNPRARLTEDDVRAIRRRCEAGETNRSLAAEFGVAVATIGMIRTRRTWASVVCIAICAIALGACADIPEARPGPPARPEPRPVRVVEIGTAVSCRLSNGSVVQTGPGEAAKLRLRCTR